MCTPIEPMRTWTQQAPFTDEFMDSLKKPRCADPAWSPMTDGELMQQTIAAAQRLNIFGLLSGSAARVDQWIAAAAGRFIPAIQLNVAEDNQPTIAQLRERHKAGKLGALGEVTNSTAACFLTTRSRAGLAIA